MDLLTITLPSKQVHPNSLAAQVLHLPPSEIPRFHAILSKAVMDPGSQTTIKMSLTHRPFCPSNSSRFVRVQVGKLKLWIDLPRKMIHPYFLWHFTCCWAQVQWGQFLIAFYGCSVPGLLFPLASDPRDVLPPIQFLCLEEMANQFSLSKTWLRT